MSTTLTPNLMSEDINASVAFYCGHLDFRFVAGVTDERATMVKSFVAGVPLQWAMLGRKGAMLMFQLRSSLEQEYAPMAEVALGASATFYLEVDDLDALLSGLGDGADIVLPDHVTFYGMREVWIRDNNGYILTLAEKDHGDEQA